jgi:uncharacterized BrkB/YihY/UPF0761 family membrane protein
MKKIICLVIIGFLVVSLLIGSQAQAQQIQHLPSVNVITALYDIASWLWTILLIVAVIFIIIGAYYFVTASGNPEQINKARSIVLYALIGVVVAGLAWGLVRIARKAIER